MIKNIRKHLEKKTIRSLALVFSLLLTYLLASKLEREKKTGNSTNNFARFFLFPVVVYRKIICLASNH